MSAPDGSPVGAERSIGKLFATATTEMSALVHDEIALAKAQLKRDIRRGAVGSAALVAAGAVALFSLPMLNFALAYGIRTWSNWNLALCFLLSFVANMLLAGLLALIGVAIWKKTKKSRGPQMVATSMKETAGVLQAAKPHPRQPQQDHPAIEAVARSSS